MIFEFTIEFTKEHQDIINGLTITSTSGYAIHHIEQTQLAKVISEITDKNYVITVVRRTLPVE